MLHENRHLQANDSQKISFKQELMAYQDGTSFAITLVQVGGGGGGGLTGGII